jgi:hypothetical protein
VVVAVCVQTLLLPLPVQEKLLAPLELARPSACRPGSA